MKVRRKIVALGTALAMAFVMIASLVMVTDVKADEPQKQKINEVTINVSAPEVDTVISCENYEVTPKPTISYPSGANYKTGFTMFIKGYPKDTPDYDNPNYWPVTVEDGKYYYFELYLAPANDEAYEFDDVSNVTINVNGGEYYVGDSCSSNSLQLFFKVKATAGGGGTDPSGGGGDQGGGDQPSGGDAQTPTTEVKTLQNGESATLNPAADGTVSFRIEKEFEHFQNGGKLYIDGQEVPTDQYYATPGSTIITLVKEYASKLSDGLDHAVKVVFDDGEFNATIKVSPASSDSTAANGTSGTASSTAATTTKVTSPKTADVLPIAGIALVFVGATAIGVIAIRRKNS